MEQPPGITRRTVLRGSAVSLAVLASYSGSVVAVEIGGARFLSDKELRTLRALVDRVVPAEDLAAGAVRAGCAEAIDGLLAAFSTDPPRIYAGAPFSDRAGHPTNEFESFLPLDSYEERAWRLRIEGSQGRPELEFNGPVSGYQSTYRAGLAALDKAAGLLGFAALPGAGRDLVLRTSQDPAVLRLLDVAVLHTMEFFYGAPEYGGNRDLVSWKLTDFDGDVQPRGYTDDQVTHPDHPGLAELLPPLPAGVDLAQLSTLVALASPEVILGVLDRTGGTLRALQAEIASILDWEADRAR